MPDAPKTLRCSKCGIAPSPFLEAKVARELERAKRALREASRRLRNCGHAAGGGACAACVKSVIATWHRCLNMPDNFRGDTLARLSVKSRNIETGCVEWTGACTKSGYGRTYHNGNRIAVHRLAWELKHGPIPAGLLACHTCDNRKCFNVEHLFLGTPSDNMLDCWRKGRHPPIRLLGEKHPHASITDAQVAEIREQTGVSSAEMARRFGIHQHTVNAIRAGRRRAS